MQVVQVKPNDRQAQRALAVWAADCAEHVLGLFAAQHPRDEVAPRCSAC